MWMASANLNGKQIGNLEDFPACKDILPEGYDYEICSYKDEAFALDEEKQFSAIVRTRALTKEGVQNWLEKFAIRSGSIFRVDRTHKPGCRTAFKVQYRCHHNTRPRKNSTPHAKHSNCNAKLTINVKRNVKRPHLSKDGYLPEFPTVIMLRHTHNHHLSRSESLKFTDPSSAVRERFLSLFESGHSVASALALYTTDVLESHDVSDHPRVTSDRRLIPSPRWVRYLHDKVFDKSQKQDQLATLTNFVQRYNAKCGEECVRMEEDHHNFSLAVCSPLMKRVHQLNNCAEFLLVDSSTNFSRFLCRVYVLQVHTAVGGLPVGVLITSSGLKKGLTKALELYTQLLPRNSFGGQNSGPSLIILGPSADEHSAFATFFPNSTLIPSVYHCLLSFWNFLTTCQHLIPTQLIPHAYLLIRRLLRSSNSDELSLNYDAVKLHPITNNYPRFEQQVSELYEQVKNWAQFVRQGEESVCGIVEASIEAFRDRILTRTKAVNPVQLLEFVVETSMEKFYLCKIECALLGQENEWFANEFGEVLSVHTQVQHLRVTNCDVEDVNDCVFEVSSNDHDQYVVDVMLGLCTCFVGRTGAKCHHQLAVKRERDLPKLNFQVLADDEDARRFYHKMLVDCGRTSDEFLALPEDGANVEVGSAHAYLAYASEENAAQVETVKASLRQVFDDVMQRLQSNPQHLLPAVQAFVDGYHTLKNDLDKSEALNNFARGRSSSPMTSWPPSHNDRHHF